MKLYELTNNYRQLIDLIENIDDEEQKDVLIDTLSAIEDEIEIKIENIVKIIKNLSAEADAFKEEENRLKKKRSARENEVKRLKEYIAEELKKSGLKKVKAGLFNVGFEKSQASVEIVNEDLIPDKYVVPQPNKYDKREMLKAMKNGEDVQGAVLIDDREHLSIR